MPQCYVLHTLPALLNIPTDKTGILELMHYGIITIPLPPIEIQVLHLKFKVGERKQSNPVGNFQASSFSV